MNRIRTAVVALAVVVVASVGLASPAQAETSHDGCTVTPGVPVYAQEDTAANLPYIFYPIEVTCRAGLAPRTVETKQVRGEQDQLLIEGEIEDDVTGESENDFYFPAAGGTKSINVKRGLVITGPAATEGDFQEVYQIMQFRVIIDGVEGSWTDPELTAILSIHE